MQIGKISGQILRQSIIVIILAIRVFVFTETTSSQNPVIAYSQNFNLLKEQILIVTDRDIYISGEEIWLKVFKINKLTGLMDEMSKIVYVELLDKNNFPLRQLKIKTNGSNGSTVLTIPEDIHSGNYLVRAYTYWMKNWTPDCFSYREVTVINPFENLSNLKLPDVSSDTGGPFIELPVTGDEMVKNQNIKCSIATDRAQYGERSKVTAEILLTDLSGKPLEADLSVSIIKSPLENSITGLLMDSQEENGPVAFKDSLPDYLPEIEGQLLSGYIKMKITDEPLANTDLSLSFVGKTARCRFTRTDKYGRFDFPVPEPGIKEIVIQPLSSDISGYYIDLMQPFSSVFSGKKASPLSIDREKITGINNAVVSMQINNIYEPYRQKNSDPNDPVVPDFYGKPDNTVIMSDYIELTSLREVVKEIIPGVYVMKQDGKYDFKLINKLKGQNFQNKPLVLLDGVPVYDIEKVLNINSKDIERADIISTRYFFAEYIFDGIVSFVSRKGNLSVLDADNSVFRQVYESYPEPAEFYSPDYSSGKLKDNRIPDFRNTLYWNPDLNTEKNGKAGISFFTSDEKGKYTIHVSGLTSDGTIFSSTALFEVE
jgi:hypothetical protein